MADDPTQEREWITGVIGEPFQLDDDGKIIREPSESPSETSSVGDMLEALEKSKWANPPELDTPTGIIPDWSADPTIGGNNDETQREIWDQMERGEFGAGTGSIPEDAETSI
jgi:hypothetical protein